MEMFSKTRQEPTPQGYKDMNPEATALTAAAGDQRDGHEHEEHLTPSVHDSTVVPTSDQRFHKLTTKLRHLTFVVLLSMLFLVALISAVAYLIHTLEALKKSNTFAMSAVSGGPYIDCDWSDKECQEAKDQPKLRYYWKANCFKDGDRYVSCASICQEKDNPSTGCEDFCRIECETKCRSSCANSTTPAVHTSTKSSAAAVSYSNVI